MICTGARTLGGSADLHHFYVGNNPVSSLCALEGELLHPAHQGLALGGRAALALATISTAVAQAPTVADFVTCFILCPFCSVSYRNVKTKWVLTIPRVTWAQINPPSLPSGIYQWRPTMCITEGSPLCNCLLLLFLNAFYTSLIFREKLVILI